MSNVVDDLIEVKLKAPDDFLKVRETLTRIGVASRHEKTLYQSCHILHKRDKKVKDETTGLGLSRYYIVHFKELFKLDGKPTNMDESDIARRNTIANILEEWGLVELVDSEKSENPVAPISQIKILPFKEKENWTLAAKYNIGNKK